MGTNLLQLDVDKLFQENTIDGVQEVHKKLKAEVDRKREELRVTVGERYRDLIEAADTIRDMKTSAENVLSHLSEISSLLNSLKHRQLVGFTTETYSKNSSTYPLHAIAAQIKLLLDIPELIWTSIEDKTFLKAAQLYLFAVQVYTNLVMDPSNSQVISWFPVVSKQWGAIKHFQEAILKEVSSSLQEAVISPKVAAEGITAVALLKSHNMSQLLQLFLDQRRVAFLHIFEGKDSSATALITSLECLETSWVLIHALFADGFSNSNLPQGLVSSTLKAVCGISTPFVTTLGDFLPSKSLTPFVNDFRPSLSQPLEPLPVSELRSKCVCWSQTMQKTWLAYANPVVANMPSVAQLANLREQLFHRLSQSECTPVEWDEICTRLNGQKFSLWHDNLQPLVQQRIQALIDERIGCFLIQFQGGILQAVEDDKKKSMPEIDVRNWMWVETGNDFPLSALKAQLQYSGLFLKCRGLTPTIVQLCGQLEQKLQTLLDDLDSYKPEPGTSLEDDDFLFKPVFDRFADWPVISNHLQITLITGIEKLLPNLLSMAQNNEPAHALLLGRLGLGFIELTPQMKRIVSGESRESWDRLVQIFRQFAIDAFETYISNHLATSRQLLSEQLTWESSADTLRLLPAWEEVTIEEERQIQSTIRVPFHLNYAVENALVHLTEKLVLIGPHTLPRKLVHNLMENVAQMSLECFASLLQNSTNLPQAVALQFLFDIKFLEAYFIPGQNRVSQEKVKRLCESLEGRIDAFDLTVISPHIQANIKRSIRKCQFLFGPLITPDRHAVIQSSKIDSKHTEPAMLLSFASPTPPKFLALPLTTPSQTAKLFTDLSVGKTGIESPKKSNVKKSRKRDASPSTTRSSAAAFFGAVSSSLFGQH